MTLYIITAVCLTSAATLLLCAAAPWGWEDENTGFHYGKPDDD